MLKNTKLGSMKEFTTIQQLAEAIMVCSIIIIVEVGLVAMILSNQIAELKEFIKNKNNG